MIEVPRNEWLAVPLNILLGGRRNGGFIARKRRRREHRMDQLHEGFNGKWFLEKGDVIGGEAIGLAIFFGQARHQDHPERLLHG